MLDEYALRLLGEMGIDVYEPRSVATTVASSAPVALAGPTSERAIPKAAETRDATAPNAEVLILCEEGARPRLLADVLCSLRMSRLDAALASAKQIDAIAAAQALIVLGESLARSVGAEMPSQRQNAINWIISHEPNALAISADAKSALWGEIKRLARTPSRRSLDA